MDGVQGSNKGPFDGSLRRIQSDLYLLGGHGKRRQEQQNKYEDASREMAPARSSCSFYPQIVPLSIHFFLTLDVSAHVARALEQFHIWCIGDGWSTPFRRA